MDELRDVHRFRRLVNKVVLGGDALREGNRHIECMVIDTNFGKSMFGKPVLIVSTGSNIAASIDLSGYVKVDSHYCAVTIINKTEIMIQGRMDCCIVRANDDRWLKSEVVYHTPIKETEEV